MLTPLLQSFSEHLSTLTDDQQLIEECLSIATPIDLSARHVLLNQGEMQDTFYWLESGVCHACYLTEQGKSFSKEFYWESDWLIGWESLVSNCPSPFLIETLGPVSMVGLPIALLHQLKASYHPFYIQLLETQLGYKEKKERLMLLYTPQERFELFIESYPELLDRLTDYQIAAYLGITPISLSRIKKRSLNKS